MLLAIWVISLMLALMAFLTMLVLVVRRVFSDRGDKRREALAQALRKDLIRFTMDHDKDFLSRRMTEFPARVVLDVSLEFIDLLRGDDRRELVFVLAGIGMMDVLAERLTKGNLVQRVRAAEALTNFDYPKAKSALKSALEDRAREVRITAAISLARLDALPPLHDVIAMIGPRGQRSRRMVELFRAVPVDRYDEIAAVAGNTELPAFVRAGAVDALGKSGEYAQLNAILQFASDPQPEVAAAALRAIGSLGHPSGRQAILDGLKSTDWEVRLEAAEAVGKFGLQESSASLVELMNDDEWNVRYAAARSLKLLGEEGRMQLERLAASPTSRTQRTASLLLAEEAA